MEKLEKKLVFISLAVLGLFTALVIYASAGLGIHLPTSHEHVVPYTEARVVSKENNRFEIYYVARMWMFEPAEVVLPEKADVHLYVSAPDVNHGFEIAGTNVNLMAVPGTVNIAHHRFNAKGEYLVVCHEYCGLNHQNMVGKIRVVPPEEYARLMQEAAQKVTNAGEKLLLEKDCAACHTVDGTESIGPTFKGMFGKRQQLTDGTTVVIDEKYFAEAIRHPDAQIPVNYEPGSMPESELTDEEMRQIIDYVKTLK